jgi:hypothetical protein
MRRLLLALALLAAAPEDAVVVAVIDSALNPYHHDFDAVPGLPADRPPHEWLPGFPDPSAFASYEKLRLTRSADPAQPVAPLHDADREKWADVPQSTREEPHLRWLPGTKVVGLLDFDGASGGHGTLNDHGTRVASVGVGRRHGTCPDCLLVFLDYGTAAEAEQAIEWALDQPWIDVVTNSYGFSLVQRDRLYSGSDTEAQRRASERGQSVFFSSGNGQQNDYQVPNTTLFSSQEGPDWILTVGGVDPEGHDWSGTGKPADVAGPTTGYPSLGGATAGGTGTFGGTSNATPVVAGTYARALGAARARLAGPSRTQDAGVVARGGPVACAGCPLADGVLTAVELRRALLHGAVRTPQGVRVGAVPAPLPDRTPVAPEEAKLMSQGHGVLWGRARDAEAEHARVAGQLDGTVAPPVRPAGEREWFVVDSWCRQQLWGTWRDGAWSGQALPAPDPLWPVRTALSATCSELEPPVAP